MDFEFLFNLVKLGFGVTALSFFVVLVMYLAITFYMEVLE